MTEDSGSGRHERIRRARAADGRLAAVAPLNADLGEVPARLERTWAEMRALLSYYSSEWLGDVQALDDDPDGQLHVLTEDAVWDEMGTFYDAMKEIASTATRIVEEYEASGRE